MYFFPLLDIHTLIRIDCRWFFSGIRFSIINREIDFNAEELAEYTQSHCLVCLYSE